MGKRISIVINYEYNENWIGGSYYVQNLIHALQLLDDAEKPLLYIHSLNTNAVAALQQLTGYPYLLPYGNLQLSTLKNQLNLWYKKLFGKYCFSTFPTVQMVFPVLMAANDFPIQKQVFWIPDFQEKHLPQFFSKEEQASRNNVYKEAKEVAQYIVFSSKDAQKDFNTFYPGAKATQCVLNFASYHAHNGLPTKESVFQKFGINEPYFLCSNQFWAHKNHIVVLQAIALLKAKGTQATVVFTGKEHDYRNPDYFTGLQAAVKELHIEDQVRFLGFIQREEQIVLMQQAKAIIQPSLFEGWSTVIEDAMAQNAYIIAADLSVNKEQLHDYPNHRFFERTSAQALADSLMAECPQVPAIDYSLRLRKFGQSFMDIAKIVAKQPQS